MKILVTGCAGFIGFHLTKLLIKSNLDVVGVDSINDYYDTQLKIDRLKKIDEISNLEKSSYSFIQMDLSISKDTRKLFDENKFDYVIHLAAQAGVRHSIENPMDYVTSNIVGFANILEGCRFNSVKHLIYASTSSVYGAETKMPLDEDLACNQPIQFYAATKKANETMAHSYSHLFDLPVTGLRFFTVYGPWGRPDMALFKFTKAIIEDTEIEIYNNGNHIRDFTYVEDISEGIFRLLKKAPARNEVLKEPPYRILNIGSNNPIKLMDFIEIIERKIGKTGKKKFMPIQPGDIVGTHADIKRFVNTTNYTPNTSIEEGVDNFIDWYYKYYHSNKI